MPAGRPAEPSAKKAMKGRKRQKDGVQLASDGMPMNMEEPTPDGVLDPDVPPEELRGDELASNAWKELLTITNQVPGWVFISDGPIVMMYCNAFSIYVKAVRYMRTTTPGDPRQSVSLMNQMQSAQRGLLDCIRAIGLSPVDRSKIIARAGAFGGKKEEDPAEKYRREIRELEKAGGKKRK